jgi:putative hydrolase of the HAD superfamily
VADLDAVLFDYGRTLVTFEYPESALIAAVERFRPAIAAATARPAPSAGEIMDRILLPLERLVENPAEDEVAYNGVFAAAWKKAGIELPEALLYEILDAEQLVWDRAATVDPDGVRALEMLRAQGLKLAICSNAPFPAEMMLRQVGSNGIAGLVDAVVFSSQIGRRKPAPEMYRAALDALGVDARRSVFVGDRVREDYEGPRALGMRAVICTAHAAQRPPDGVPTIDSLAELPGTL